MSNMKMIIQGYNKRTLSNIEKSKESTNTETKKSTYNCRNKNLKTNASPRT